MEVEWWNLNYRQILSRLNLCQSSHLPKWSLSRYSDHRPSVQPMWTHISCCRDWQASQLMNLAQKAIQFSHLAQNFWLHCEQTKLQASASWVYNPSRFYLPGILQPRMGLLCHLHTPWYSHCSLLCQKSGWQARSRRTRQSSHFGMDWCDRAQSHCISANKTRSQQAFCLLELECQSTESLH